MAIEWQECEVSGSVKGEGDQGTYWVTDMLGNYSAQLVVPTRSGPEIINVCQGPTMQMVQRFANQYDSGGK